MKSMKLAIVGSRNIRPFDITPYLPFVPKEIISGGARGVDSYARKFAIENNIPIREILPNYMKFGRGAPLIRDKQIVDESDFLLAFWDGKSRGTKYTIDYADKRGVPSVMFLMM